MTKNEPSTSHVEQYKAELLKLSLRVHTTILSIRLKVLLMIHLELQAFLKWLVKCLKLSMKREYQSEQSVSALGVEKKKDCGAVVPM